MPVEQFSTYDYSENVPYIPDARSRILSIANENLLLHDLLGQSRPLAPRMLIVASCHHYGKSVAPNQFEGEDSLKIYRLRTNDESARLSLLEAMTSSKARLDTKDTRLILTTAYIIGVVDRSDSRIMKERCLQAFQHPLGKCQGFRSAAITSSRGYTRAAVAMRI